MVIVAVKEKHITSSNQRNTYLLYWRLVAAAAAALDILTITVFNRLFYLTYLQSYR